MAKDVRFFVSFSSRDLKFVREIMAALKGQNIDFWDYSAIAESIEVGTNIDKRLTQEIDTCTHMLVVISKNSMDTHIGRFCRFEMEYAINRIPEGAPSFIPVMIESPIETCFLGVLRNVKNRLMPFSAKSHRHIKLKPPYDIFKNDFRLELDESPESIVTFAVKVCQTINKDYFPPIEAHANLPFWKMFRKEVLDMAHSNNVHVDAMIILGEFNEHYKRVEMQMALKKIEFFIAMCDIKVPVYKPFYPLIVKAVCETELKMFEEAMKSYEKAKSIHPKNQDVIGGIGTVYFKIKEYGKAADCFEQIIANGNNEDITNARINLIITNLAMEKMINDTDVKFLFQLDISGYSKDLQTAIYNAKGIYYRLIRDYTALEELCKEIIRDDLHDTITIRLLQLSYLNRKMKDGEEVIRKAIKEAENNSRLDKSALKNYLKDINE